MFRTITAIVSLLLALHSPLADAERWSADPNPPLDHNKQIEVEPDGAGGSDPGQ